MSAEPRDWGDTDRFEEGAALATQLEAVNRRKWPMLIAFCTVLVAAIAAALLWPATYRAMGTILIEQQEVPLDFVRSAVTSYADERVQVISQRVMTSANLLGIIDKHKLYDADRQDRTREQLVERMRKDVQLQMISSDVVDPRAGRTTKATIAFAVGYESRSPELAARVANDLVTLYLQKNIETRTQLAAGTTDFLSTETEKLRARIGEIEQRISAFKEANYDRLPEFSQSNAQVLARAGEELRDVDTRIQALNQQIVFLDSQLAQLDPHMPTVSGTGQAIQSPAQRVRILREQYISLLWEFAPRHPTAASIRQELQSLEQQAGGGSAALQALERLEQAHLQLANVRERKPADPAEQQRLEGQIGALAAQLRDQPISGAASAVKQAAPDNPAYVSIQAQRESAGSERSALAARRSEINARIVDLEQRQLQTPAVERDYTALQRELQGEQTKYAEVRQKLMEAQLAQNLETEQKGERFTLIEPPLRPQEPIRPNRPAIFAIGLLMALGAAVGLLALLEAVDTRIRGRRQVVRLLGVPPLAIIPWVGEDEQPRRFQFWRRPPANAAARA